MCLYVNTQGHTKLLKNWGTKYYVIRTEKKHSYGVTVKVGGTAARS